MGIWACLWRIVLIRFTEVGSLALCERHHSLGWEPCLTTWKGNCELWTGSHCFLLLTVEAAPSSSCCCLLLPNVIGCNLKLWAKVTENVAMTGSKHKGIRTWKCSLTYLIGILCWNITVTAIKSSMFKELELLADLTITYSLQLLNYYAAPYRFEQLK